MPYTEVLFKPGSRFSYSNPCVIYLGRIVELLSHDDFEVYIGVLGLFRAAEARGAVRVNWTPAAYSPTIGRR